MRPWSDRKHTIVAKYMAPILGNLDQSAMFHIKVVSNNYITIVTASIRHTRQCPLGQTVIGIDKGYPLTSGSCDACFSCKIGTGIGLMYHSNNRFFCEGITNSRR